VLQHEIKLSLLQSNIIILKSATRRANENNVIPLKREFALGFSLAVMFASGVMSLLDSTCELGALCCNVGGITQSY